MYIFSSLCLGKVAEKTRKTSGLLANPPHTPSPPFFYEKNYMLTCFLAIFKPFLGNFCPFLDPKTEVWFLLPSETPPAPARRFGERPDFFSSATFP